MPRDPSDPPVPDFYSLPSLYDILHAPGTYADVVGLEKIARRFAGPRAVVAAPAPSSPSSRSRKPPTRAPCSPLWLEPACGTARHLRLAAKRGYRVAGVDLSDDMLDYARERFAALDLPGLGFRGKRVTLARGDIAKLDTLGIKPRSVDFAFNLINSIRHLKTENACAAHLRAVARVLKPHAVYAVGISLSSYGHEAPTEDVWKGSRGRTTVTQAVQYIPAFAKKGTSGRFEQVISHLTIDRPAGQEHKTLTYSLLSYDMEQWCRTVDKGGMRIVASVTEQGRDNLPAEPGYNIFVLAPGAARPVIPARPRGGMSAG